MAIHTYVVNLDATTAVKVLPSPDGTVVPRGTSEKPTELYLYYSGAQVFIGGDDLLDDGSNGFPLGADDNGVYMARAGDELYATRAAGAATSLRIMVIE